jgi:hypothetical protein
VLRIYVARNNSNELALVGCGSLNADDFPDVSGFEILICAA